MVDEGRPEHVLPHRRPPFNRRQLLMQVVVAAVILISGIGIGAGGTILALRTGSCHGSDCLPPRLRWSLIFLWNDGETTTACPKNRQSRRKTP